MNQPNLSFSVIIPTYARPQQLACCLQALTQLQYPQEQFEVIVVDDGSPTSLDPVIGAVRSQLNIQLVRQKNAGPAAARNYGAALASGDYLAFTDDDCQAARGWLAALAHRSASTPQALVGGRTVNALADDIYASTSQIIVDIVYAHYNRNYEQARFVASNNIALPAEQYRAIGGFNSAFRTSEDRDLCDRWRQLGLPMIYAPEALVYHRHNLDLPGFWQQHFGYGQGAFRYHWARAKRGTGHITDEMSFHLRLPSLFRRRMAGHSLHSSAGVLLLLLVWQIANAAGYFWERTNGQHRPL